MQPRKGATAVVAVPVEAAKGQTRRIASHVCRLAVQRKEFERNGWVRLNRGNIEVLSRTALERFPMYK